MSTPDKIKREKISEHKIEKRQEISEHKTDAELRKSEEETKMDTSRFFKRKKIESMALKTKAFFGQRQALVLHGIVCQDDIFIAWLSSESNPHEHCYIKPLIEAFNQTVHRSEFPKPLYPNPIATLPDKRNFFDVFKIDQFTERRDSTDLNANKALFGKPNGSQFTWRCFVYYKPNDNASHPDNQLTIHIWLAQLSDALNRFMTWCHEHEDCYGQWNYNPIIRPHVHENLCRQPVAEWLLDESVVIILETLYSETPFDVLIHDQRIQDIFFGRNISHIVPRALDAYNRIHNINTNVVPF